ncbi:hypothetical protein Trydic_g7120 [Trypoxylus dichotomus]
MMLAFADDINIIHTSTGSIGGVVKHESGNPFKQNYSNDMASRDKKVSVNRKQSTASPVPPKEGATPPETLTKSIIAKTEASVADEAPKLTSIRNPRSNASKNSTASLTRKIRKKPAGKVIKKNISLKAKSKSKLNQKLGKKLLTNSRNNFEVKQSLLRNGIKAKVTRKAKPAQSLRKEESDDNPPVLEPIYPINETAKSNKKRPRKLEEEKKIKEDESNDSYPTIDEALDSILSQCNPQIKANKKKIIKKIKSEPDSAKETIDDVINDLTTLIKVEEIKSEVDSDIEKLELKAGRKPLKNVSRLDLLKKLKKENIENKFEAENKVIDMLDLNVDKRRNKVVRNRRHSIEKYPIGCGETNVANLTVFSNIPRSISPRAKRASKVRQSIDLSSSKRSSPYTTRSDSPARILRNGKHRKLKDMNLLEGLDCGYRKRRRLCSDYSGSEISVSKSGYESDSSFSDLASLHGAENSDNFDIKSDVKKDFPEFSPIQNHDGTKSLKIESTVKRSLSLEAAGDAANDQNLPPGGGTIDSNSNVCDTESKVDVRKIDEDKENPNSEKIDDSNEYIDTTVSPSSKVPEKSIILDIMKQTFNNDVNNCEQDKDKRATRSSMKKGPGDEKETVPNVRSEEVTNTQSLEQNNEKVLVNGDQEKADEIKESMENEEAPITNCENLDSNVIEPNAIVDVPTLLESVQTANGNAGQILQEVQSSVTSEIAPKKIEIVETPESLAIKESILQALGLQSLRAAEEAKQLKNKEKLVPKNDSYTGTLKTVIKLNRNDKKRGKNSLKMTLQKDKNRKGGSGKDDNDMGKGDEESSKHMREGGASSSWKAHGGQSSDTAGALRKSHYANRSNMDASSEHTSDGDTAATEDGAAKSLVIPEKASSFSIHPGRLCKDECSYCFGKFGLFDTPCHIAQMKSVERQDKILAVEKHLTRDSCLCDACYRHVDRKTNTPSYANNKRNALVTAVPKHNLCHVLGCKNESTTNIRRKWAIKVKNICKVININLDNPGLHLVPICEEHFNVLEHLMTCAMCKRKLARNHIHYLGPEAGELNEKLNGIGIPVKFNDKPVICKFCKYFATLLLTDEEERPENSSEFYKEYTKRLLHYHDIEHMDEAEVEEPIPVPTKDKCEKDLTNKIKKKKVCKPTSNNEPPSLERQTDSTPSSGDQSSVPLSESREESPDYMVDYNTLIPNIALECGNDAEKREVPKKQIMLKKIPRPESIKEAVEISKNLKLKNKSDIAVQRLGSNPSISVRQLFPGEEDLPLQGCVDFHNVKERTPEGWEKCTSTIQFDLDTKQLWQELQKPYGNQSSFLRHLILLEKYFRNGDLILSPNASHHSVNYSESVQNRLRAYDNTPSNSGPIQPLSMIPFNKPQKSSSGIITSRETSTQSVGIINAANIPKNTPITITQLSNSNFIVNSNTTNNNNGNTNSNNNNNSNKVKTPGVPPGLMPLQPGTSKPVAPLVKVPQPQKIKFPITKNWKPNLIPIDPTKKTEKRPGLVQVISGGKPYHITLEDYKKMCAIKRTFDLKQKKLQDAQKAKLEPQKIVANTSSPNSLLKTIVPRKSLVISKTSTITSPRSDQNLSDADREESSLEKLDRQVEKLEAKFSEAKSVMILPKIPKSLTVIPQTVTRKPSRSSSPALQITPKPNIILPSSKS